MASEIRVNKINSQTGVGTITLSPTGVDISGITTVSTLKVGTGVTASEDGDIFFTGVCTATTFSGAHSGSGANLTALPAANITGALPAISAANLTNIPAANVTGTLPAISGANLTGITAGITEADQWRITSNFSMATTAATVTANWERNDNNFEKIGTGMTIPNSDGKFTFPSTGIYLVSCNWHGQRATGNTYSATFYMYATTDNFSSGSVVMESFVGSAANNEVNNAHMSCIFDVQNTSTHRCFFGHYDYHHGSTTFYGHSDKNYNAFTFIKLGET